MNVHPYRRIVGFGEAMLRLTVPVGESIEIADRFLIYVGGAELNGLIAAARAGRQCVWVSALPDNPMSAIITGHALRHGVDPLIVSRDRGRVGLYFLGLAAAPRPAHITYDRAGSSFAVMDPSSVSWHEILDDGTCFYTTGISAAVGSGPREALDAALDVALEVGATVAIDVNYRPSLWSSSEASTWLRERLDRCDILSASAQDLEALGFEGPNPHRDVREAFGLAAVVGMTKDLTADGRVNLELVVTGDDGEHRFSGSAQVIDPVGTGDAMFGTFLAEFDGVNLADAGRRALNATITSYGLSGDALTTDPWPGGARGGVRR